MKLKAKTGSLKLGNKVLGPASALYVDSGENVTGPGVVRRQMPNRMDYAFALKSGKVVGLESKKLSDLISSHRARRLQRQLRDMFDTVDIPILILRSTGTSWRGLAEFPDLMLDLVKFQLLGGIIAHAPADDASMYEFLGELKATLEGNRNLRTVIAGTDKKKVTGTKFEARLQRLLDGCGPAMARRLARAFPNISAVLMAPETALKEAGATRPVIKQIKEMR